MSDDAEYILGLIKGDRASAGSLQGEPLEAADYAFADYLALIGRFRRGDDLTTEERRLLSAVLVRTSNETLALLAGNYQRREAGRRGGLAGRVVPEHTVLSTWTQFFEAIGKKGAADMQTAATLHLSERQVRRIRSGHK